MQVFPLPLSPYKTLHILHCSNFIFSLEKLKLFIQSTSRRKSRRQHGTARWRDGERENLRQRDNFWNLCTAHPAARSSVNRFNDKSTKNKTKVGRIDVHVSHTEAHCWFHNAHKLDDRERERKKEKKNKPVLRRSVCYWSCVFSEVRSHGYGTGNESGTCHLVWMQGTKVFLVFAG